jgi:hypothetical protein
MNRLIKWIGRRYMLKKLKAALAASAGKTSERTAIVAAVAVKLLALYAPAAAVIGQAAGYLDMTPDQLVGGLIGYAILRFSSKMSKVEPVEAGPRVEVTR